MEKAGRGSSYLHNAYIEFVNKKMAAARRRIERLFLVSGRRLVDRGICRLCIIQSSSRGLSNLISLVDVTSIILPTPRCHSAMKRRGESIINSTE
mmetsp:Transcript_32636/g.59844  ORF Transcript_32636/g.59844 Transcript_32636/m.59844 type:complete len:95 (-) Transcript_32636:298-582(-)